MLYDFACNACDREMTVKASIHDGPTAPICHRRPMRRLYAASRPIIQWGISDYVERAVRGEESVPGMTQQEVKQLVDISFTKS